MNYFCLFSRFQCMLGFVLAAISSNVIGKYGKATCNEDGIWTSDSKCIPIQCKELSGFDALVYNCSNGNNFRSVCRTICPQNKVSILPPLNDPFVDQNCKLEGC